MMHLLLTILSVLSLWALIALLSLGIYCIRKALENARVYLEKIAMGVRAIEKQTMPVAQSAEKVEEAMHRASAELKAAAERSTELAEWMDRGLPPLLPAKTGL